MTYETLNRQIKNLSITVYQAKRGDAPWKEVWDLIREIRQDFKDPECRYPSAELRQYAWNEFQLTEWDVNRHREERARASAELRDDLLDALENVYQASSSLRDMAGVVTAMFQGVMMPGVRIEPPELTQLKNASRELQEIRAKYHAKKQILSHDDNNDVWVRLQEIRGILDAAWADWKSASSAARRDRLESALLRLEDQAEKLDAIREKIDANLNKNIEQRDSARNDDFRARVEEWIEQDEERLEDIDRKRQDVERRIREITDKLHDL